MHKKIIIAVLFFTLIFGMVNAIVVDDIGQKIDTTNAEMVRQNAELNAKVTALTKETADLRADIQNFQTKAMLKEDLVPMYKNINTLNHENNGNILVLLGVFLIFAYATLFLAKAKKWL